MPVAVKRALLVGACAAAGTLFAIVGPRVVHGVRLRLFLRQYRQLTEEWMEELDAGEGAAELCANRRSAVSFSMSWGQCLVLCDGRGT